MGKSQELYREAKKIIPGGTQLLSKRPEMFLPDLWPAYYSKARGCNVWDLDGNKYIDMSYMGIGACILGYADEDVNRAVIKVVKSGNMTTLNAPEEVALAKLLIKIHPWAEMVRYARTGGEAMAIAVRIARAHTGKDVILFCGYHGWHDWYLSANLASRQALDGHLLPGLQPKGVPRWLRGTSFPFNYNDVENFSRLVRKYRGRIAAVVVESIRNNYPDKNFFPTIQKVTRKLGAVLIVDEITAGFRLNIGGAHLLFNLEPDIAVFAKGISNGYPMAAIIGKKKIMKVAQETFISSTYWTEKIGPAAAIATIEKLKKKNIPDYLIKTGKAVQDIWEKAAQNYQLKIKISGIYPLGHFIFEHPEPLVLKTLFTQKMLSAGFLATTAFYACYAHRKDEIVQYSKAVEKSFQFIRTAIESGQPRKFLSGPVCHSGFKRLT